MREVKLVINCQKRSPDGDDNERIAVELNYGRGRRLDSRTMNVYGP